MPVIIAVRRRHLVSLSSHFSNLVQTYSQYTTGGSIVYMEPVALSMRLFALIDRNSYTLRHRM
jgi:hypothetical protein